MNNIDYLPEWADTPRFQNVMVVEYIESYPNVRDLWYRFCSKEFMKRCPHAILYSNMDTDLYDSYYERFYGLHHDDLQKLFLKKYGDNYDQHRMVKVYGVFENIKDANRCITEIRDKKHNYGNVYIQTVGKFVPFNPTEELKKSKNFTNEKLKDIAKARMERQREVDIRFEERKRVLASRIYNNTQLLDHDPELLEEIKKELDENKGKEPMTKENIEKTIHRNNKNIDFEIQNCFKKKSNNKKLKEFIDLEIKAGNLSYINKEILTKLGYTKENLDELTKDLKRQEDK